MLFHKLIDFVVDINGSVIDHCKMYNQLLNVSDWMIIGILYYATFKKHFSYTLMVNFISWGNPQYSEKITELTAIVCEKNRIERNILRKPPH